MHALVCQLLLAAIPSVPALPVSAPQDPQSRAATRANLKLHVLRHQLSLCEWENVARVALELRFMLPRGSDEWLEAMRALAGAHHRRFDPARLEEVARDALAAATARRLAAEGAPARPADPAEDVGRTCPPRMSLAATLLVVETQALLAGLLQHHDLHHEAVGHLRLALDDLERTGFAGAEELHAEVSLSLARSLAALGYRSDARAILSTLRDKASDLHAGTVATVLLQADLGPAGYAGKYAGDPRHVARIEEYRAALPRARARVARRFGVEEAALAPVALGLADRHGKADGLGGLTSGETRVPAFPVVIAIFSEAAAMRLLHPEQALVHELCHAVPMSRWGARFDLLPSWLNEALARALSGEHEHVYELFLASLLLADARAFVEDPGWLEKQLDWSFSACGKEETLEAGMLGLLLAEKEGALARFVAGMESGKTGDEALRAATGMSLAEYRAAAILRAIGRLREERERCLPWLARILEGRKRGAEEWLAAAEEVAAAGAPAVAEGHALQARAEALEELGRWEPALDAWDRIVGGLPRQALHGEFAWQGRARVLLALSRNKEALEALADLRRDAMRPEVREWAERTLVERQGAGRR